MASGLAAAGVAVDIATTDDDGPGRVRPRRRTVGDGVTFRYFPRQTRFYTFSWPLTRWLAGNAREYDVVHIHALFSYTAIPAALTASRAGVPYVMRPAGTLNRWGMANRRRRLKALSFRLIERRILEGAAAIQCASAQERVEADELGFRARRWVVIPPGVDVETFTSKSTLTPSPSPAPSRRGAGGEGVASAAGGQGVPAERGSDSPIILFLSRIDRKKGLELLIAAFGGVREAFPGARLVIAGSGDESYEEELRRMIDLAGITEAVTWLGFVEGEEKATALGAATVFALPSHSENFGVAAVEALAAGAPVVLSSSVGIAPEVEGAEAGLVVPNDAAALRTALERLLGDEALRCRLAANGRGLARERWSTEVTTRQLVALYDEIVGSRIFR
jgi:glycosyltransferase involved in cell wall biosynthesis